MSESGKDFGVPGPDEIISELRRGLKIKELTGEIKPEESQDYFNEKSRILKIVAVANPNFPWERGSTQVEALRNREKELLA